MSSITRDFTKGSIPKQLLEFSAPLFLASLLQIVYNMVDMIVVGQVIGEKGLSAVSVGGDVSNMLLFLGMGLSNAGQVIISKYLGAQKKELLGKFIATMFSFLAISAVVLSLVCGIFTNEFLILMNTPKEAFSEAYNYSIICIIGMVFIFGYNAVSATLRGLGDSRHPFVFIAIAALMNIALDIIFVIFFNMGAGGAALATVMSQCASFVISVIFLYKKRHEIGFEIKTSDFLHIDKALLIELLKLGLPMAIKSASIHFSKLFVNSFINSYGVAVSAFSGIANKISSISNLLSNSLNTAGSSMVGQNIGAKTYKRIPKILLTISAATISLAIIMTGAIYLFPTQIFSIFTDKGSVLKIALEYLPVAALIFFGSALRAPANAIINGSGNYKVNFLTAILDGIVMRIGLSVVFGLLLNMKYFGFWLGDALAGFTPLFIGIVFYLKGSYKNEH